LATPKHNVPMGTAGKAQLSKAEEKELARKEREREEAFEAWLSKKKEQAKVWYPSYNSI